METKRKELESFFQNDVWEMVPKKRLNTSRSNPEGPCTSSSNGPSGRMVSPGQRPGRPIPDALSGTLSTDSPTLSRAGRNFILSIANTGWNTFSADVSTAFLQGKEHPSHRTLWIQLPADARRMLGIDNEHSTTSLMRLRKPMYGLRDAPRAWYTEAREHIAKLGAVVHPLDPCLFLVHDYEAPEDCLAFNIGTLQEANKCLRFAKQYCDVGLKFDHLGSCKDLAFKILLLTVTQLCVKSRPHLTRWSTHFDDPPWGHARPRRSVPFALEATPCSEVELGS